MTSVLNQTLAFPSMAAGAQVAMSHDINVDGIAKKPDFVFFDQAGFEVISCTQFVITIKNGNSGPQSVNVWLQSIDSPNFPAGLPSLTPNPFPVSGGTGIGSGSGTGELFQYVVVGNEPDLANLVITLPTPRLTTTYLVFPSQETCAGVYGMMVKTASKTKTQFVLSLSTKATAGDTFDFYVDG